MVTSLKSCFTSISTPAVCPLMIIIAVTLGSSINYFALLGEGEVHKGVTIDMIFSKCSYNKCDKEERLGRKYLNLAWLISWTFPWLWRIVLSRRGLSIDF